MPRSKSRRRRSRSRRSKRRRSRSRSRSKSRGRRKRRMSRRRSAMSWISSSSGLLGLGALIYIMSKTKGAKVPKTRQQIQIDNNKKQISDLKALINQYERRVKGLKYTMSYEKKISGKKKTGLKNAYKKLLTYVKKSREEIRKAEKKNKILLEQVHSKHKFPNEEDEKHGGV